MFAAGLGYQAASCVVAAVSLGDACHVELVVQGYVAAVAKDRNQDPRARIGIGIALKTCILALPNFGTTSNVNQPVINLLARYSKKF